MSGELPLFSKESFYIVFVCTLTGMASISSSSEGCLSRDRPLMGLGESFFGGSGGGTSSTMSSWISWLLLFFFFFPLRLLSGVALIWSAKLNWSSSSSAGGGGGGGVDELGAAGRLSYPEICNSWRNHVYF